MPAIMNVPRLREILDSRGNPTVEVDVYLEDGAFGRAANFRASTRRTKCWNCRTGTTVMAVKAFRKQSKRKR